ncbi:unnamed protein product [Paramecium octaurelia]|uniref:Uncharacterized protein n=1 Tax=Paramecium octaurelia TaxID=43137 RepID=A0A8S1U5S0_PAROT|nr:unnamed protein product [Paramecium octaurelia]
MNKMQQQQHISNKTYQSIKDCQIFRLRRRIIIQFILSLKLQITFENTPNLIEFSLDNNTKFQRLIKEQLLYTKLI